MKTCLRASLRMEGDNIIAIPATHCGMYEIQIAKRDINPSKLKELKANGTAFANVRSCNWYNAKPYNLTNPVIS